MISMFLVPGFTKQSPAPVPTPLSPIPIQTTILEVALIDKRHHMKVITFSLSEFEFTPWPAKSQAPAGGSHFSCMQYTDMLSCI